MSKDKLLSIRLSQDLQHQLQARADTLGVNVSAAARQLLCDGIIQQSTAIFESESVTEIEKRIRQIDQKVDGLVEFSLSVADVVEKFLEGQNVK